MNDALIYQRMMTGTKSMLCANSLCQSDAYCGFCAFKLMYDVSFDGEEFSKRIFRIAYPKSLTKR